MLKLRENEYIVDGTPADCVNLAVLKLMRDDRPALVVSGINFGPNLGDDVTYSGTISAAFEGALLDVPSIAFSTLVGEGFSFERCAEFAEKLIRWALDHHHDPHIILNVNFPVEFSGVPRGSPRQSHLRRRHPRAQGSARPHRTTGSAAASRRGVPAKTPTSKRLRKAASPSRRCTSTSRITNRSRVSNRSRSSLATQRRDSAPQPDFAHLRARMVQDYVAGRGIKDERILQAMRDVPRHLFVPTLVAAKAYGAGALPIGAKQTISQPYIVARMIELLDLTGKEKVLEIGTGTGYQAVVLSKLCAKVFSIERDQRTGACAPRS